MSFTDRHDAGRQLAAKLKTYADPGSVCALALPRGGVPVAYEVAKALGISLDVLVVRKIGAPHRSELAIGAIASGGVELISESFVRHLRLTPDSIEAILARERLELDRRERAYRGSRPLLDVEGKTVLLIDDGIATGASMQVAVTALRQRRPARIVVAVPVVERRVAESLALQADQVIAVVIPQELSAVGEWYEDFSQTSDEEVCRLLAERTESQ